jgi:hypothetical protein
MMENTSVRACARSVLRAAAAARVQGTRSRDPGPVSPRTLGASRAMRAAARVTRAGLDRILIAAAAVRGQGSFGGGAVSVSQGTLVFDGVAISETSARVQALGLAQGGPVTGGRPAADGWSVQTAENGGGAVYMAGGTVTFTGGSTITGTTAVRIARRTRARAQPGTCKHSYTGSRAVARTNTPTDTHAFSRTQAHTCTQARAHTHRHALAHPHLLAHVHTHTCARKHTHARALMQADRVIVWCTWVMSGSAGC